MGLLLLSAGAWGGLRPPASPFATAAAAGFAALALLSTAWSVEPRTTFERAVSLGFLFSVCVSVARAVQGRPQRAIAVLQGFLVGAAVVGVAGLILLAVDHHRAIQAATYQAPARFTGLGQDPNTVALLFAVTVPLAVWALLRGRRRPLAAATLALLAGTIVASGSHGAVVAGGVGAFVVTVAVLGRSRAALVGVIVVTLCVAVGAGIQAIPKPSDAATTSSRPAQPTGPKAKHGYLNGEAVYPLDADIGQPLPGGGQPAVRRGFFGSSGRLEAWQGALHEAARRPVAGHGFGTEQAVFVDRFYRFVGSLPENSYIGLALQLGIAGLVLLALLVIVLGRAGIRALRGPRRDVAAAGLGVLAAGLVIALVQSYLYSVGNIATAAVWITAFLLPAMDAGV